MKAALLSISIFVTFFVEFEAVWPINQPHASSRNFSSDYSIRQDSIKYKVYKIDSINNFYLIYAKNENRIFKIVSQKLITTDKKIVIGKEYKFRLHSFLMVNGKSIIPADQINELSGWGVNDSTNIDFEGDSIRNLFYADNIKGLCFIRR